MLHYEPDRVVWDSQASIPLGHAGAHLAPCDAPDVKRPQRTPSETAPTGCHDPNPSVAEVLPQQCSHHQEYPAISQAGERNEPGAGSQIHTLPTFARGVMVDADVKGDSYSFRKSRTSFGEATAWTEAADPARRETLRIRTGLPDIRGDPKQLDPRGPTPRGAKALTSGGASRPGPDESVAHGRHPLLGCAKLGLE